MDRHRRQAHWCDGILPAVRFQIFLGQSNGGKCLLVKHGDLFLSIRVKGDGNHFREILEKILEHL